MLVLQHVIGTALKQEAIKSSKQSLDSLTLSAEAVDKVLKEAEKQMLALQKGRQRKD